MVDGDPHAFDLVNRGDDDSSLDLTTLRKNIAGAAPIWEAHLEAPLAADECGPIGDDFEDDDV